MYKADEREGIGEMRWTDGSVYLGQWHRGIQHGYGKMIFPDGTIKEGNYESNIFKENSQIVEAEIPSELKDTNFNISKLDPKSETKELKLPAINKPNRSFELSIGKKQKSLGCVLNQKDVRGRVGKSSVGSRMLKNLDKNSEYKTAEVSNHIRTSSHTNKTLDLTSNVADSIHGSRAVKMVKKKRAPYWLPSGNNISFNKLMKIRLKTKKKSKRTYNVQM